MSAVTTPERLRRRQLVEGACLILIGALMLAQAVYFQRRADAQRECLASNFQSLTVAIDARSTLSDKETAQNRALWDIYAEAAGIVKDDPTKPLDKADQDRLNTQLVHQLLEYQRVIRGIQRDRADHPFPPYPAGQCN